MATFQIITTITDLRRIVGESSGSDYYTTDPTEHDAAVVAIAGQLRDEAHDCGLTYGQDWGGFLDRFEVNNAIEWLEDQRARITDRLECEYCGSDLAEERNPADMDDQDWATEATRHADDCEWIDTRAHTRTGQKYVLLTQCSARWDADSDPANAGWVVDIDDERRGLAPAPESDLPRSATPQQIREMIAATIRWEGYEVR